MWELQTYIGVISNDTEEWWKIWKGTDLPFQNWHKEFDECWLENSKVSKLYTLMDCFWPKYIMFELKKYRGAIFHDTKVWCKIWRKTDLWFGKWHEELRRFSPEHTKFSKLGLSLNPFIQSRKCMSLKLTGVLCVMTMNNDAKFEIELTCCFKIDMRNLTNFDPSTQNLKNLHFNGLILTKVNNVSAKKIQRNYLWLHSRLTQSLKGNWLLLAKVYMRNLPNFHQSTWKSLSWDLDGIVFSKVEGVWA